MPRKSGDRRRPSARRKRCPNGSRKSKSGVCVKYTKPRPSRGRKRKSTPKSQQRSSKRKPQRRSKTPERRSPRKRIKIVRHAQRPRDAGPVLNANAAAPALGESCLTPLSKVHDADVWVVPKGEGPGDSRWEQKQFGIFHQLGPVPRIGKASDSRGAYNVVQFIRASELPWTQECSRRLLDKGAGDVRLIMRQGLKPQPAYVLAKELALTALCSDHGIGPTLYGARMYEADTYKPYDAVKSATMDMITEAYDGSLQSYLVKHTDISMAMQQDIGKQLLVLIQKLAKLSYLCVDLKPQNLVYREVKNKVEVRMIDFDVQFCGREFQSDISFVRPIGRQIMDLQRRFLSVASNKIATEADIKMREAFMVLLLRSYVRMYFPTLHILRPELQAMYDAKNRMLNGVPLDDYQKWFDQNVLRTSFMFKHYMVRKKSPFKAAKGNVASSVEIALQQNV